MRRQLLPAVKIFLVFTVLVGLLYPLAMTGAAQVLFGHEANGSMVKDANGDVVGSSLIGQSFTSAQYFHPRPSAAGDGYDPTKSGASNLGPTNQTLLDDVSQRAAAYRAENGLAPGTTVPVDAVTSSGERARPPDLGGERRSPGSPRRQSPQHVGRHGARADLGPHRRTVVGLPR